MNPINTYTDIRRAVVGLDLIRYKVVECTDDLVNASRLIRDAMSRLDAAIADDYEASEVIDRDSYIELAQELIGAAMTAVRDATS